MIMIIGEAKLKPEQREAAFEAVNTMSEASMAEDGCHDYRFWTSTADPNLMLLVEQWESEDAIKAHFAQPHMAVFGAALGPVLDGGMTVTKYEIASSGPLTF